MGNQKRSNQHMPIVTETQFNQITSDLNRPSTSRCDRNSKIGTKDFLKNGSNTSTPYRRSDIPSCVSPELLWQPPEILSCLESLGASMTTDSPYEIFGLNSADNTFERVYKRFDSLYRKFYKV